MTTQTWLMIGGFLLYVIITQLGRREYTKHKVIMSLTICGIIAYKYIKEIPTSGNDVAALAIMIVAGIAFGLLMQLSMKIEYGSDGKAYTIAGTTYLILWIVGLGSRIVVAYYAQDWNPQGFMEFLMKNHLDISVITPAFILFTIAMLFTNVISLVTRFRIASQHSKSTLAG
ncbi:hypothetical protein [Bacillus thuringiensis]|uniref:hypothetical protein n=1 Tax=Bacillus thuringiensis TaxID=1428 RepID=UPI000CF9B4A5|nr:hypothetical protein [Bacillus thuringiensis]PQQ47582.1 hypothetical protein C6A34_12055 [Bacillus thuringiensis]